MRSNGIGGARFRRTAPGRRRATAAPSASGAWTYPNLPADTYNLAVKGDRWLQRVAKNIVAKSNVANVSLSLLPGDLNGDNVVDLNDFTILAAEYGLSGPNLIADLNLDGAVDLSDFSLFAADYGLSGDTLP
jgi:hypothetical protein